MRLSELGNGTRLFISRIVPAALLFVAFSAKATLPPEQLIGIDIADKLLISTAAIYTLDYLLFDKLFKRKH